MDYALAGSLKMSSQRTRHAVMRIELFNVTIFKFAEKFDHQFSHVFIFGNMFPESHGFVAVPVTRSKSFVSLH